MKNNALKTTAAALCAASLLVTGAFAAGSGTGSAVYSDSTVLTDGLTYENAVSFNASGKRVETYTIDLGAQSSVRPIVLACDTIYGGLTATQMIAYAESLGYDVLGAVNSDFYYTDTKIPCGMVVEDGIYKCSSDQTNALAITDDGAFFLGMPTVNIILENQSGDREGQSVSTLRLNKTRDKSGLFLYTEHFSTVSTRTSTDGWMVKMKILEGEMSVQGEMTLEVIELYEGDKAQQIGKGNIILTADSLAELDAEFQKFAVGDIVTLTTECSDERLSEAKWVTGCGNALVLDGKVNGSPSDWNASLQGYNPRTAVGVRADGSMVFYVVDGRTSLSSGATMLQLAEDLIDMGCVTVVNMDGGGSTTLAMRNGKTGAHDVINIPSDGSLRRCAAYILFVSDGTNDETRHFLSEDGQYILAGATLDLSVYSADGSLRPVALAGISLNSARGKLDALCYTAPAFSCIDIITLSSGEVYGQGELHIIDKADTLTVKNAQTGASIKSLAVAPNESVKLSVSASMFGRDVCISGTKISYSCSDGVGTITQNGVFTASATREGGSITVEAAGLSVSIPVSPNCIFSDINSHWAQAAIEDLYDNGIVSGTSADTFSPDADMKRGDFILMLYRACGKPDIDCSADYSDVPADSYYAKAIAWAQRAGIAYGNGDGTFSPQATLTREQAFAFVYRALPLLKINSPEPDTSVLAQFSDGDTVSPYAVDAVSALIELGVVSGSDGKLAPQDTLTRAQMARILYSCLQK